MFCVFQSPENEVLYSLVVGNNAPSGYFTIDSKSGVITVNERVSYDLAQPDFYLVSFDLLYIFTLLLARESNLYETANNSHHNV